MYGYGFDNMGMFGFGMGWFIQLVLLAVIIWAVFYFLRHNREIDSQSKNDAMNTLKNRYAKGEISKEEFERIKKDLE